MEYKLILVGDGGVGKTTFVSRHLTGEYEKKYIATIGAQLNTVYFDTTKGRIKFNIWDTAGQEKFGGLRDMYYEKSDCAILMFDLTSRITYKNIPKWYSDITRICEKIPMCLVGNKCELSERKVKDKAIRFRKENIKYFEISCKNNNNFELPFLNLIKKLLNDDSVKFIKSTAELPPVNWSLTCAKDVKIANSCELPDTGDEII